MEPYIRKLTFSPNSVCVVCHGPLTSGMILVLMIDEEERFKYTNISENEYMFEVPEGIHFDQNNWSVCLLTEKGTNEEHHFDDGKYVIDLRFYCSEKSDDRLSTPDCGPTTLIAPGGLCPHSPHKVMGGGLAP